MRIIKLVLLLTVLAAVPVFAQNPPPPPTRTPAELDQMVARIALYPDSLVAQILAAATYPDQIPDAAKWADEHHYLSEKALADAIQGDQLPWDPSVQALLPFPSVLETMAGDMNWTTDIGNAFLAQQAGRDGRDPAGAQESPRLRISSHATARLLSAVGRTSPSCLLIPDFVVVPYYDPAIVFFAPRPGFVVGGAIRFGFGVSLGVFFRPWGWG